MMQLNEYKVGDRVRFDYLGETDTGTVTHVGQHPAKPITCLPTDSLWVKWDSTGAEQYTQFPASVSLIEPAKESELDGFVKWLDEVSCIFMYQDSIHVKATSMAKKYQECVSQQEAELAELKQSIKLLESKGYKVSK